MAAYSASSGESAVKASSASTQWVSKACMASASAVEAFWGSGGSALPRLAPKVQAFEKLAPGDALAVHSALPERGTCAEDSTYARTSRLVPGLFIGSPR
jgi:hypothetical protein